MSSASTPVCIPRLGVSMTEATLLAWLATEGAAVQAGDPLYALEAEKIEMEVEAPASGTLHQIGRAGETYPVGEKIAELHEHG